MKILVRENATLKTVAQENISGVRNVKSFNKKNMKHQSFCPITKIL